MIDNFAALVKHLLGNGYGPLNAGGFADAPSGKAALHPSTGAVGVIPRYSELPGF
jgi:hypothetical protein